MLGDRPTLVACCRARHGLGNRVRVVLSARSLAEALDRDFRYVWPTGRRFGPRLEDLWRFDAPTLAPWRSRLLALRSPYVDHRPESWAARRRDRVLQIRTPHALPLPPGALPWPERLRALEPHPAIAERVRAFRARALGEAPYVGVMIRAHRASHAATLATSPAEWFVERMKAFARRGRERFFVSCDVPEVAAEVIRAVPGAVTQSGKGAYNSVEGIRAAVADLYLLAGSSYLLGPERSSFVELAWHLAGGKLSLERPTETAGDGRFVEAGAKDPLRPHAR